jgi:hypothetical protein
VSARAAANRPAQRNAWSIVADIGFRIRLNELKEERWPDGLRTADPAFRPL